MAKLTVAEVLERAADLIEPEGAWTQGRYGTPGPNGSYSCLCMFGALSEAGKATRGGGGYAPHRLLDSLTGGSLVAWNDREGRTQAEVVAKLREAAALARESSK